MRLKKSQFRTSLKPIFSVFLFLIFALPSDAQPIKPVEAKFSLSVSQTEVKVGDEIELIFKADIPATWYIYSNDFSEDVGPVVASFFYEKSSGIEPIGKAKSIGSKKKMDEVFGGEVSIFVKKAEFRQKIKIKTLDPKIHVELEYQMCSEITGQCVLYNPEFTIKNLKVTGKQLASTPEQNNIPKPVDTSSENGTILESDTSTKVSSPAIESDSKDSTCKPKQFTDDSGVTQTGHKDDNLWLFAFFAFLGGLAGLLTPCVFPMIPMTVTFFLKSSGKNPAKGRFQGILYGIFIIAIYTIIGTLFTVFFGATGANEFSTNAVVNIIFFVVFVIFAISFFGAFEITLPSGFINKIDKQSDKGGMIGVFFMAFTLVLVSFSCTGPIVGTILVEASQGAILRPVVGMIGFSLAFALPFTLFAIFPNWLNTLPKSGGWLNSVKVVLGFVELALGLKFLSVADQVYHWHLLDRDIYIGLWIVIAFLCGLYLLGKIKFAHDSDMKSLSVPRLFLAIASFAFVFYLIPGLFGAPLAGLSGYLPPTTSHNFNLKTMLEGKQKGNICEEPKYSSFLHLPHGLSGYFEYEQAMKCAKQLQKPVFIDFTGHGCVNCRKMEDKVWSNPEILELLRQEFVLTALYVDDRTEADSSEWRVSKHDGKLKKTIGKINADIQICDFDHIAQPFYVMLDNKGNLLAQPIGSEFDVQKFKAFLNAGIQRYKKQNPDK